MPRSDPSERQAAVVQRWYSPRQAADYTGLTPSTIRKHIREGRLRAYIPEGSRVVRILVDDLDALVTATPWSADITHPANNGITAARARAGKASAT